MEFDLSRYDTMTYRRCGASGLLLPAISLGFWHNFGGQTSFDNIRAMSRRAFDLGITHFDLANNYGPPPGSAESSLGQLLRGGLRRPSRRARHLDEGRLHDVARSLRGPRLAQVPPVASLDASLARMGIDYVDIFYHHRPDPDTPLEETMGALAQAIASGKALYVGFSNYPADRTREAAAILTLDGSQAPHPSAQVPYARAREGRGGGR